LGKKPKNLSRAISFVAVIFFLSSFPLSPPFPLSSSATRMGESCALIGCCGEPGSRYSFPSDLMAGNSLLIRRRYSSAFPSPPLPPPLFFFPPVFFSESSGEWPSVLIPNFLHVHRGMFPGREERQVVSLNPSSPLSFFFYLFPLVVSEIMEMARLRGAGCWRHPLLSYFSRNDGSAEAAGLASFLSPLLLFFPPPTKHWKRLR